MDIEQRHAAGVDVRAPDDCWPWTGACNTTGYGTLTKTLTPGRHTSVVAHRIAWQRANGPIPDGLLVLHDCDNKVCQNPAHLHLGTQRDNMREASERGQLAARANLDWRRLPVDRDAVRARHASGESQQAIADSLGIGQSTVSRIVRHVHVNP